MNKELPIFSLSLDTVETPTEMITRIIKQFMSNATVQFCRLYNDCEDLIPLPNEIDIKDIEPFIKTIIKYDNLIKSLRNDNAKLYIHFPSVKLSKENSIELSLCVRIWNFTNIGEITLVFPFVYNDKTYTNLENYIEFSNEDVYYEFIRIYPKMFKSTGIVGEDNIVRLDLTLKEIIKLIKLL